MREQPVTTGDINHPSALEEPAASSRDFPCFVEFLAGEAPGFTQRAPDAIEQRGAGKSIQIVVSQPGTGGLTESSHPHFQIFASTRLKLPPSTP